MPCREGFFSCRPTATAKSFAIEYAPVKFSKSSQALWLPESTELFFDFHGRRTHRRHYFRNYMLFSVHETQKTSGPKATAKSNTAESPQ
jgi:hypothetical protein